MTQLMLWQWYKHRHICENYSPRRAADDTQAADHRTHAPGDCSGTRFYHWGALGGMISMIEAGRYSDATGNDSWNWCPPSAAELEHLANGGGWWLPKYTLIFCLTCTVMAASCLALFASPCTRQALHVYRADEDASSSETGGSDES